MAATSGTYDRYDSFPTRQLAITPSDATDLVEPMLIYVGVAGNVALVDKDDVVITYAASAGAILPVLAKRINATGTTATGLVGLR